MLSQNGRSLCLLSLPKDVGGYRFDCQYFDKLNMTIKTTFETASFTIRFTALISNSNFRLPALMHQLLYDRPAGLRGNVHRQKK
jgi:hypothetical protein